MKLAIFLNIWTILTISMLNYKERIDFTMGINSINKVIPKTITYGKHKVPRYIYHFTDGSSYESMLKDGFIKAGCDDVFGRGIFMVELTNLFRSWGVDKAWDNDLLINSLLRLAGKDKHKVVVLRIPTDKLNHNDLKIRSISKFFKWLTSSRACKAYYELHEYAKHFQLSELENWREIKKNFLNICLNKTESKEFAKHLIKGDDAKFSHLYKQRREAIEYIYKNNISMSDVQKVGEMNFSRVSENIKKGFIKNTFEELFEGAPEAKWADNISCAKNKKPFLF